LQRVAVAITRVCGSVQSSQVDVQGPKSKDGYISLLISCEMEQANLQKLLYDLEAGMPFLFIDQLVVQGPQESTAAGNARMRILVAVSGQWKGTK
jgi:general secretion pathway protein M